MITCVKIADNLKCKIETLLFGELKQLKRDTVFKSSPFKQVNLNTVISWIFVIELRFTINEGQVLHKGSNWLTDTANEKVFKKIETSQFRGFFNVKLSYFSHEIKRSKLNHRNFAKFAM